MGREEAGTAAAEDMAEEETVRAEVEMAMEVVMATADSERVMGAVEGRELVGEAAETEGAGRVAATGVWVDTQEGA